MNVAMGTSRLATWRAWQLAKLLPWHSCQFTQAGIGVWVAFCNAALSEIPIKRELEECAWCGAEDGVEGVQSEKKKKLGRATDFGMLRRIIIVSFASTFHELHHSSLLND